MTFIAYWVLGIGGCWLLSDGLISIFLYANSQSWRGTRQSWAKDHWIRLLRCLIALAMMVSGWVLVR